MDQVLMFVEDNLDHHLVSESPQPLFMGELPRNWSEIPAGVVINMCGVYPKGDPGDKAVFGLPMLDILGAILPPALVISMAWVWLRPRPEVALFAWFFSAVVAAILKWQGLLTHIVVGAAISLIILIAARFMVRRK